MLDYDKPLAEQSPQVLAALRKATGTPANFDTAHLELMGGWGQAQKTYIENLGKQPGSNFVPTNAEHARQLREAGIRGIRYFDGGSRATGEGTSNYVLFDDQLPKIMEVGSNRSRAAGIAAFPELAERYPEKAPPVEMIDAKSGKPYLAKQLSPEAERFQAARAQVVKDMKKNGYEPFFDPAKRSNVDPAAYPELGRTLTEAAPKKQATVDKWIAEADTPEARANLNAAYDKGAETIGQSGDWYAMRQLEGEFIRGARGRVAGSSRPALPSRWRRRPVAPTRPRTS